MSAPANDRNTHEKEGCFRLVGVTANAKIFGAALVVVNAAGFAEGKANAQD